MKKFAVTFVAAGAMILSAAAGSYRFTVSRDATVAGKELKAGDYKIEMKGDMAVLKHDGQTLEVPAHMETEPDKFSATTVRYREGRDLEQVGFGGTHTKIVFTRSGAPAAAAQ